MPLAHCAVPTLVDNSHQQQGPKSIKSEFFWITESTRQTHRLKKTSVRSTDQRRMLQATHSFPSLHKISKGRSRASWTVDRRYGRSKTSVMCATHARRPTTDTQEKCLRTIWKEPEDDFQILNTCSVVSLWNAVRAQECQGGKLLPNAGGTGKIAGW